MTRALRCGGGVGWNIEAFYYHSWWQSAEEGDDDDDVVALDYIVLVGE